MFSYNGVSNNVHEKPLYRLREVKGPNILPMWDQRERENPTKLYNIFTYSNTPPQTQGGSNNESLERRKLKRCDVRAFVKQSAS